MAGSLPATLCFPTKGIDDQKQEAEVYQRYIDVVKNLPESHREPWPWSFLQQYQGFSHYPRRVLVGGMVAQDHFKSRPGDVLLATLPKVGTTWLKALTFAVNNRNDNPFPLATLLSHNPHECVPNLEFQLYDAPHIPNTDAIPSPRLFATHMQYHILPKSVLDLAGDCKIIYLCRNPRDTFVALWKFFDNLLSPDQSVELDRLFDFFLDGIHPGGQYCDHVRGYWEASRVNPERVLFLRYEEVLRDTTAELKKLAAFLGHPFSPEEEKEGVVEKIVNMCSIKSLSNLKVNHEGSIVPELKYKNSAFFRKGVVGDWVNHLTPEMVERLDRAMNEQLQGCDLSFVGYYDP